MKTFHTAKGAVIGKTMTVKELRTALNQWAPNTPVFATWEGVIAYVAQDSLGDDYVHKGKEDEECLCVVIDVGQY